MWYKSYQYCGEGRNSFQTLHAVVPHLFQLLSEIADHLCRLTADHYFEYGCKAASGTRRVFTCWQMPPNRSSPKFCCVGKSYTQMIVVNTAEMVGLSLKGKKIFDKEKKFGFQHFLPVLYP